MMQSFLAHYAQGDVVGRVLSAVGALGHERVTIDHLAPLDEFHVRGRDATFELGRALRLERGMRILDLGCGIGGPARRLAVTHGCGIVGIDLVADYCRIASALTAKTGITGVAFAAADALALPFADAAFPAIYTQHVAMNVADKAALYREVARVLQPGGRFGIYDLLAGAGGAISFPVPWARSSETSFVADAAAMHDALGAAGFEIEDWQDKTDEVLAWFARQQQRQGPPPKLTIGVLLGADFPSMLKNLSANIRERRVAPTMIVCRTRR